MVTRWISTSWRRVWARIASRSGSRSNMPCATRKPQPVGRRQTHRGDEMARKIGQKTRTPMPCIEAHERVRNFREVACGYTAALAVQEATRCIDCRNRPCVTGCPVEIDIPSFVRRIAASDFEGAFRTLTDKNILPAVCGRVCPQENQCEKHCTLGVRFEPVAIGRLERFVADWHGEPP